MRPSGASVPAWPPKARRRLLPPGSCEKKRSGRQSHLAGRSDARFFGTPCFVWSGQRDVNSGYKKQRLRSSSARAPRWGSTSSESKFSLHAWNGWPWQQSLHHRPTFVLLLDTINIQHTTQVIQGLIGLNRRVTIQSCAQPGPESIPMATSTCKLIAILFSALLDGRISRIRRDPCHS